MNRTFTEMFGCVVGDFIDIPDWTLKYPILEQRERAWSRWRPYFDHPDNKEFLIEPVELDITCKDGTVKTVIHSGIILPEAGWALATFIDITQRKRNELLLKRAEEQASQNEAIYQLLLKHSQEMVILIALDGSRRDVSPAVQQSPAGRPRSFYTGPSATSSTRTISLRSRTSFAPSERECCPAPIAAASGTGTASIAGWRRSSRPSQTRQRNSPPATR